MNISVIGLGKLGLPFSVALASKGFQVIGVDIDETKIKALNNGIALISETDLQEMLIEFKESIFATSNYDYAFNNSDVTFVLVNTPSNLDGSFSTIQLEPVCQSIGKKIRYKNKFHTVVIMSTVTPLTCEKKLIPILEKESRKKSGIDFGFCYVPEFIALGSAIHDFLYPDFVLIGESDPISGQIIEKVFKQFISSKIFKTNIVNAEIAKIALNCFLTTKISYANTLGEICDKLHNANAEIVTSILALDHRICGSYFKPGLGYGGPCFPRDNKALIYLSKQLDCQYWLAEATEKVNEIQIDRVLKKVKDKLGKKGTVAILGLSYKPNTEIVEESQSLEIAKKLSELKYHVKVYDPQAMSEAKSVIGDSVIFCDSLHECLNNIDLYIITTPWKEFKNLDVGVPSIKIWD